MGLHPLIPAGLIEKLEDAFPDRLPAIHETTPLEVLQGQQQVIAYIKRIKEDSEDDVFR